MLHGDGPDALKHWRPRVEEGATVAELAQRLGYRSEATFARAFKRVIGIPPGAVKKEIQAETHETADAYATVANGN